MYIYVDTLLIIYVCLYLVIYLKLLHAQLLVYAIKITYCFFLLFFLLIVVSRHKKPVSFLNWSQLTPQGPDLFYNMPSQIIY